MRTALWRSITRVFALRLFAFVLACLLVFQPAVSRADISQWFAEVLTDTPDVEDAARSGEAVPPGATVTGPGETRTIRFGRDVLQLYPSTVVTFQDGSNSTVRLISGTVRVKAAKRKDGKTLSVETLTLVATVKGTDFEVSTVGNVSAVSVYEGRVAVKAVGVIGGMDVTRGKTATVSARDKGGKLGDTPRGGAPEAAKQAAKGAGSADAPTPSEASKQQPSQSKPSPNIMSPAPKPAAAGPAASDLEKKDKNKPAKPDKKDKAGPPKPRPH
jgi:hypothetical protein